MPVEVDKATAQEQVALERLVEPTLEAVAEVEVRLITTTVLVLVAPEVLGVLLSARPRIKEVP